MNTLMLMVLAGMVTAAGIALLITQFAPTHARLADAVAHAAPTQEQRTRPAPQAPGNRTERAGMWAERHLAGLPGISTPVRDLRLIGQSTATFWGQKVTCALLGLAFPALLGALMTVAGLAVPVALPVVASLIAAAGFWFLPDADVRSRATAARAEFAAAAVAYLRLVAIRRLGGRGIVDSMTTAANLSQAWMFRRVSEELTLADMAGTTPWDALARLSEELSVPELREIADIARMSQAGSGVSGAMMARAASMRDRILSREHTEAVKATTSLALPTAALLFALMATLMYPLIVTLLA